MGGDSVNYCKACGGECKQPQTIPNRAELAELKKNMPTSDLYAYWDSGLPVPKEYWQQAGR